MANDPNPSLRAQLVANVAVLAPEIRVLPDLAAFKSISGELFDALTQQLEVRVRRLEFIQAVLDGLDLVVSRLEALEADGWPTPVPHTVLPPRLFNELQGEQADVEAAVAIFRELLDIKLGAPTFSANPILPTDPGP